MKKSIIVIVIVVFSTTLFGQTGNWSMGVSAAPLIQLHKSGTSFFDFKLANWKLYYRGSVFEINSNYYVNDKISVLINLGAGYSFYDGSKHSESFIVLHFPNHPQKSDICFFTYGVGVEYDFYNINEKWKLFASGSISLYNSIYQKHEYNTFIEENKSFDFLALIAKLGCGIKYQISSSFNIYIKPNLLIRITDDYYYKPLYYPNLCLGVNYKLNKN
ncbi:MAG: hypothetical protein RBR97_10305 [Bacteroidales bacterium]|nr:hypothetical protein [Bacteroidales bacterium]